ncbi:Rad51-like protein [Elsinoe australis]|uniref:Rad51-like protein n=1 Tax=Elsinoe australis TaxID=40998 RepID=A0A4U7AN41_9PEZI|nr:Rad51-like protein [Elsinoe australis]
MTDLLQVSDFDTSLFTHIVPSLERSQICCNDILTLDAVDIAKRASVPSAEIRRLKDALITRLQSQLEESHSTGLDGQNWSTISTLDEELDTALGGGFPVKHLIEVTGESAAGKTQLLLSLCLSVQLPAPYGVDKEALYITTEAPLQTTRLAQILRSNPVVSQLELDARPTLARVHGIKVSDLESQEHILQFQVPVAIERHNIGLIVVDSIAANFRAEFDRGDMNSDNIDAIQSQKRTAFATRTRELVSLGTHLRHLAQKYNLAVVVANQVLDRFTPPANQPPRLPSQAPSSQISSRQSSQPYSPRPKSAQLPLPMPQVDGTSDSPDSLFTELSTTDPLALDHQQRFTTGWGHISSSYLSSLSYTDPHFKPANYHATNLKTPSLGQVWTSQLSGRIVLLKSPVYKDHDHRLGIRELDIKGWRRFMSVVFAGWTADHSGGLGAEFEIWEGGVRGAQHDQDAQTGKEQEEQADKAVAS